MSRHIKDDFLDKLKISILPELVQLDDTLDMQLRGKYVQIYYRGCPILTINMPKNETITDIDLKGCDPEFFQKTNITKVFPTLSNLDIEYIPQTKHAIDVYITTIKESSEIEIQQFIVRNNNYSRISNSTDYFIIDIEYKTRSGKEFDLVAVKWDSEAPKRKTPKANILTIFELKIGENAIGSSADKEKKASISMHMKDYKEFTSEDNIEEIKSFKDDMLKVFKQKRELGLVRFNERRSVTSDSSLSNSANKNHIKDFDTKIEFGFIFAELSLRKNKRLVKELGKFEDDFLFVRSSFMGYGLYSSNIGHREDFMKLLSSCQK